MSLDVAISSANLTVFGVGEPPTSAEAFVRAVFLALEGELDASLGDISEVVVIPALDIHASVGRTDPTLLAAEIGRAIAARVVAEARARARATRSRTDGALAMSYPSSAERRATLLLEAARVVEGTIGAGDAAAAEVARVFLVAASVHSGGAAAPGPGVGDRVQQAISALRPIGPLGWIARRGALGRLAVALDDDAAIRLLERVLEEIEAGPLDFEKLDEATAGQSGTIQEFEARVAHALAREAGMPTGGPISGVSGGVRRVLAVALAARVDPLAPAAMPALARSIRDLVRPREVGLTVGGVESARSAAPLVGIDPGRPPVVGAMPSGVIPQPGAEASAVRLDDEKGREEATLDAPPEDSTSREIAQEPLESPTVFPEDDPLESEVAGLAFLARPVLDLGWSDALAAVRPAPSIALNLVLHRILEIEGVTTPDGDPMPWLLAGLLAAPDRDDLALERASWSPGEIDAFGKAAGADGATTLDEACDAWARAILAETRLRLDESGVEVGEVGEDVLRVRGEVRGHHDRIEVAMGFIFAYEALLRAGLSFDIMFVPWLDNRSLKFTFG
jgi:hypothetical protein